MNEFLERPTVKMWKRHMSAVRWEQRLARAPFYRIALLSLLIIACIALVVLSLVLQNHVATSQGVITSRP